MHETRRMRPMLGTFVEVAAAGSNDASLSAVNSAFERISRIGQLLSFQNPDSEISRLNHQPGHWVPMSLDSLRVLRLARSMTVASGGRFNCTVGGQLVSWGALPDHIGKKRLDIGTAQDIEFRPGAARLMRPVRITLDGIAKGYSVDMAIRVLKQHGIPYGWVNAGGDLRAYGPRQLRIMRREKSGPFHGLTYLRDAGLATSRSGSCQSGDLPGRMVGGSPDVEHGVDLSVLAPWAWRADALTKVAAACNQPERTRLVRSLGGFFVEGVLACAA